MPRPSPQEPPRSWPRTPRSTSDSASPAPGRSRGRRGSSGSSTSLEVSRRTARKKLPRRRPIWRAGSCGFGRSRGASAATSRCGEGPLLLPGITAGEQAGLSLAALAPLAALLRAAIRSVEEIAASSPAGLEALGVALRGQSALGLACLLLLVPASWGFTRALARGRGR